MATTGVYENRRNAAACFAVEKTEDWHPDFRGVMRLEDGKKCWVHVFKRPYVSVRLRPFEGRAT